MNLFDWNSPFIIAYITICVVLFGMSIFRYRYKNREELNELDKMFFQFCFGICFIYSCFLIWINFETVYFLKPLSSIGLDLEKIFFLSIALLLVGGIVSSRFQHYVGGRTAYTLKIQNENDPKWVKVAMIVLGVNALSGFLWFPVLVLIHSSSAVIPYQPGEDVAARIFLGGFLMAGFFCMKSIVLILRGKDDKTLGKIEY